MRPAKPFVLILLTVCALALGGCEMLEGTGSSDDYDRDDPISGRDPVSRDRYDDRYDDRSGNGDDVTLDDILDGDRDSDRGYAAIPRTARMLDESRGEISIEAPDDGRMYVYDVDARRLVYSTSVRRGERFTVKPEIDKISLDGVVVFDSNLERRNEHRVYFDRR